MTSSVRQVMKKAKEAFLCYCSTSRRNLCCIFGLFFADSVCCQYGSRRHPFCLMKQNLLCCCCCSLKLALCPHALFSFMRQGHLLWLLMDNLASKGSWVATTRYYILPKSIWQKWLLWPTDAAIPGFEFPASKNVVNQFGQKCCFLRVLWQRMFFQHSSN